MKQQTTMNQERTTIESLFTLHRLNESAKLIAEVSYNTHMSIEELISNNSLFIALVTRELNKLITNEFQTTI